MVLTPADLTALVALRHRLHATPEVSGEEQTTATTIAQTLAALGVDTVITGLGGHGVAAVFNAPVPGPSVMVRCELDALPIQQISTAPYRSVVPGKAHLCGHDGHMAIVIGLAQHLVRHPLARGRVVLLFQPAEEDGSGAAAVLADPRFASLACDWAFALHNMPGLALGAVALAQGPANCASRGLKVAFTGHTSHAATPEHARSPALAVAGLIGQAMQAGPGGDLRPGFRLVTVTHARLGDPAFGITPGAAEVWLTLRCLLDTDMAALQDQIQALAQDLAAQGGLSVAFSIHDDFAACTNHPDATEVLARAVTAAGLPRQPGHLPMRASEDFGRFGQVSKSAMLLLGSGANAPPLHNPDYDFPDALIAPGVQVFTAALRDLLGAVG